MSWKEKNLKEINNIKTTFKKDLFSLNYYTSYKIKTKEVQMKQVYYMINEQHNMLLKNYTNSKFLLNAACKQNN